MGPVLPLGLGPARGALTAAARAHTSANGGPWAAVLLSGPALPRQRARRRSEFVLNSPPSSVWLRLMSLPGYFSRCGRVAAEAARDRDLTAAIARNGDATERLAHLISGRHANSCAGRCRALVSPYPAG